MHPLKIWSHIVVMLANQHVLAALVGPTAQPVYNNQKKLITTAIPFAIQPIFIIQVIIRHAK